MAEHTPGEWVAIPPNKVGKHWRVGVRGKLGGSGPVSGADVLWDLAVIGNGVPGDTLDTEEANARLIAAAPDLLAAAREVLAGLNARIDAASAAGKPVPMFAGVASLHAAIAKATGQPGA